MQTQILGASLRSNHIIKLLVFLFCITSSCAFNIYLPSLPEMADSFKASPGTMQLSITSYLFGFALFQLVLGPCSDRFGRRKVALFGLLIAILSTIGCIFAHNAYTLILLRLLQGAGMSVSSLLMRAIMRDAFTGIDLAKTMAQTSMVFAGVLATAPVLGGYIHNGFGWEGNFIFILLSLIITLLATWWFLPETNQRLNANALQFKTVVQTYKNILSHKLFMCNLLLSSMASAGIVAYNTAAPFLFQNGLHLSSIEFGWLSVSIAVILLVGQMINLYLLPLFSLEKIVGIHLLLMLLAGVLMLVGAWLHIMNIYVIMLPVLLFVLGSTVVSSNTTTKAFDPFYQTIGSVAAAYGCIQILIGFIASLAMVILHENSQLGLSAVLTLISITSLCLFGFLLTRQDEDESSINQPRSQTS